MIKMTGIISTIAWISLWSTSVIWCSSEEEYDLQYTLPAPTEKLAPGKMKAIVLTNFGLPEILHIASVPIPSPGEDQMLVKVHAAGINSIDTYIRSGMNPGKVTLPTILGKEISGVVEKINATSTTNKSTEASQFKKGDRVFCGISAGGYAEYAIANLRHCHILPEHFSFSQGAAIYTNYFSVYRALFIKGKLKKGESVLLFEGSGNIQVATIQLVKQIGAYVVATLNNPDNDEFLKDFNCDFVVHNASDDRELRSTLNQTCLNRPGFDIIFERFDNNYVDEARDREFLNENGRIVVIGNSVPDDMVFPPPKPGSKPTYAVGQYQFTKEDQDAAAEFVLKNMAWSSLPPYVGHEYKFEQVNRAHFDMTRRDRLKGKLVLIP